MKKTALAFLAVLAAMTMAATAQTVYQPAQYHGPFLGGAQSGSPAPLGYLGPYFELPQVYDVLSGGAQTNYAGWTLGTVYPDGTTNQGVKVAANPVGLELGDSETSCNYPTFTSCDILYSNSSGTVGLTTAIATASGAGNTVLAYIETGSGGLPTVITYPYQLTRFPPFTSGDIVGPGGAVASAPVLGGQCTGAVTSSGTDYIFGLGATATTCATTTGTAGMVITSAGTLENLYVNSSAAVVGGASVDVATILINGTSSGITCTIAASGTQCHDATHTATVAAGNVITASFVTAASDTAANLSVYFEKH